MISIYTGAALLGLAVLVLAAIFKPAVLLVLGIIALGCLAAFLFLIDPPFGAWLAWWRRRDQLEEDEG
jgi:hypothetical protein